MLQQRAFYGPMLVHCRDEASYANKAYREIDAAQVVEKLKTLAKLFSFDSGAHFASTMSNDPLCFGKIKLFRQFIKHILELA